MTTAPDTKRARFWQLLTGEYVRVVVNIRRWHEDGQPSHWDSESFGNEATKALVSEREELLAALEEAAARIKDLDVGDVLWESNELFAVWLKARAAIDKARGQTSS